MENSLDRLIKLLETSSNPIDLIELYIENYKIDNVYILFNESERAFSQKKQAITKIIQNMEFISQFFIDRDVAADPTAKALFLKIKDIIYNLEMKLEDLCDAWSTGSKC